jgi:D-alanyl-D-alanine carboxypeptidase
VPAAATLEEARVLVSPRYRPVTVTLALLLAAACAGCGNSQYAGHWDGRRGYDGYGDYGYDLAASNAEARNYRSHAARSYPVPGDPVDPWGPYIREAVYRFQVPERWVREVMQQESGGRLYGSDGDLLTSPAGAMGLMQVMPQTYDMLRQRYALGDDPYDPRSNILAGTSYIREMYDRYGAPGFLAAYDAGPDRVDAFLSGGSPLPDETINYLTAVAPRLGNEVALTGPLAAYAGTAPTGGTMYAADRNPEYPSGVSTEAAYSSGGSSTQDDPSVRAFDGGGLITARAPTGELTGQPASPVQPALQPVQVQPALVASHGGRWGIQVGAYGNPTASSLAIQRARAGAADLLLDSQPTISPIQRGTTLYRARLMGLSADAASEACARLAQYGLDCIAVRPGS